MRAHAVRTFWCVNSTTNPSSNPSSNASPQTGRLIVLGAHRHRRVLGDAALADIARGRCVRPALDSEPRLAALRRARRAGPDRRRQRRALHDVVERQRVVARGTSLVVRVDVHLAHRHRDRGAGQRSGYHLPCRRVPTCQPFLARKCDGLDATGHAAARVADVASKWERARLVRRAGPAPAPAPPPPPALVAPKVFTATGSDRPGRVTEAVGRPSGVQIVAPVRLLDTRDGTGTLTAGEVRRFDVPATAGVPGDAQAVFLNATVVGLAPAGWVAVGPCDGELGRTCTVNWFGGAAVADDAVIGVSNSSFLSHSGRSCSRRARSAGLRQLETTHRSRAVAPARLLDTRQAPASMLGNGEMRRTALPADVAVGARAAAVTITAIGRTSIGYVSA